MSRRRDGERKTGKCREHQERTRASHCRAGEWGWDGALKTCEQLKREIRSPLYCRKVSLTHYSLDAKPSPLQVYLILPHFAGTAIFTN